MSEGHYARASHATAAGRAGIMGGMTSNRAQRLRRTAHEKGLIASPSLAFMGVPFGPDGRDLAGEIMASMARRHSETDCPICNPSGDFPRDTPGFDLDSDLLSTLIAELEALGWDVEYAPAHELKIGRRDPATGKDASFCGAWMSWRMLDGAVVYGVGPERDPHDILALNGPTDDAKAVAAAADRAMHALWHKEQDEQIARLGAQNAKLSTLTARLGRLTRFPLVTSRQIRAVLAEAKKASR